MSEKWQDFVDISGVIEISKLVAKFNICYKRAPEDFEISVYEHPEGTFSAVPNYSYWGPGLFQAHKSVKYSEQVDDALKSVLEDIVFYDSADYPNDLVFWIKKEKVLDGNRNKISLDELNERRKKLDPNTLNYEYITWDKAYNKIESWWLIIKNNDERKFCVIGPVEDDREYIKKALEYHKQGKPVSLETIPISDYSKEKVIEIFQSLGFSYSDDTCFLGN